MKKVIVIAPHPDDETLGCGGTILRHRFDGDQIFWIIVTGMTEEQGYSQERILERQAEIKKVKELYGFEAIELQFPPARLDQVPLINLVEQLGQVFRRIEPEIVYVPFPGDVHTDHRIVFDAAISCTKWFRYKSIKRILLYETISETDFGLNPTISAFRPNVFVDIGEYIDKKIEIFSLFRSEVGKFPFPRSEEAIRAHASLRGTTTGCDAAEGFMLLKEIIG